jgi:hypothetical protein
MRFDQEHLTHHPGQQDDFEKAEQLEPSLPLASVAKGLEEAQTNDLDKALRTVRAKLALGKLYFQGKTNLRSSSVGKPSN